MAKELKKINLQLFAEESTEESGEITEEVLATTTEENATEELPEADFGLDNEGNIHFLNNAQEDEELESVEELQEQGEQKFKVNINGEEKEVSLEDLLENYQNKSVADSKQETQLQQMEQINQQPEQQQPSQAELFTYVTNQAKKQVAQIYGEDFDEYNPNHIAAFNFATNQIYGQCQQYEQQLQQQQNVTQQYNQLLTEYQAKDPANYPKIVSFEKNYWDNLPNKRSRELIRAGQGGDWKTVRSYFDEVRKAYYKQIKSQGSKQQKVNPPVVEGAGQGTSQTKARPDFNKLGKLSLDDQAKFFIENGLV